MKYTQKKTIRALHSQKKINKKYRKKLTGKQEVGIYERLEKNMYKEIGVNKKMCAEISINNQIVLYLGFVLFCV